MVPPGKGRMAYCDIKRNQSLNITFKYNLKKNNPTAFSSESCNKKIR